MPEKNASSSIWEWVKKQVSDQWVGAVIALGNAGAMTYLAAVTDFLKPFAPLIYGGIWLATLILTAIAYYLYAISRAKIALANYSDHKLSSKSINVLDDRFQKTRLDLSDFFHPFSKATENAKFQDCELFGPAAVFFSGGSMLGCTFNQVDVVIFRPETVPLYSIHKFERCIFERCVFFRITMFMTKDQYENMKRDVGQANVVSLGS